MKKILIIILIILLSILLYNVITKNVEIINLEILGIQEIKKLNEEVDQKLEEAIALTSVTYPERYSSLISAGKELQKTKQEFDAKSEYTSEEELANINVLENYEIEYIWTSIGNYATKKGVNLKIEVLSTDTPNVQDWRFILTGEYIGIADVISNIENDDTLGFKIEEFKVIQNTSDDTKGLENKSYILQATFMVRGISVNISNISSTQRQTSNNQQNTVDGNTTTQSTNTTVDNTIQ